MALVVALMESRLSPHSIKTHELNWRDMNLAYAAVEQMAGKYLVQDRVTKTVYESPQFLYMLVGMCLFAGYDKSDRYS